MYNTDIIKINNLLEAFFDAVNSYLTGGGFRTYTYVFSRNLFSGNFSVTQDILASNEWMISE